MAKKSSSAKKTAAKPAKQKVRPKAKPSAKPAAVKSKPAKSHPVKPLPKKTPPAKPAAKDKPKSSPMEKPSKKNALRDSILKRKVAIKPIAFSLDEVRAIAKTAVAKAEATAKDPKTVVAKPSAAKQALALEKAKPMHVKAASLADILGFNPKKAKSFEAVAEADIPEKFKRYYKLLMDLRLHLTEGIERHSEETLKRSSKDDAGDLSSYGQHMADAGTDTFDRDFALSLVSSEQEALGEIDAAIKRIKDGSYGLCEITQAPISRDRLLAVPFTRYSADAQKELERNRHRSRTQAGILGELGEDGGGSGRDDNGGGGDE